MGLLETEDMILPNTNPVNLTTVRSIAPGRHRFSLTGSPAAPRRGIALLIVLGMLVLLSAIVVAFMTSVTTDLSASRGYEGGAQARLLADSAVNLVIAQIKEASTQQDQAWISQPGLIRTYEVGGKAAAAYKLYSSDSMVVQGEFDPAAADDLPKGDWREQVALWTDLNAPAYDATRSAPAYPILDGNHMNSDGELALDGKTRDIEGFSIDDYGKNKVSMPVKWMYILKDGTLAPASEGPSDSDQRSASVDAATSQNPIVARIAFWTDDETAKVNINTASEGTFWDTPVANSQRAHLRAATTILRAAAIVRVVISFTSGTLRSSWGRKRSSSGIPAIPRRPRCRPFSVGSSALPSV
jgi:uncharacterized protein (TIGR02600 family)